MNRSCTYFMLLQASAHWRALDRDAQRSVFDRALERVFNGYPELRMSHYASGAFHGRCSHVIVWEAGDVAQYHAAVEALHAEPFFGAPLFEIVDVIQGVEAPDDDADTLRLSIAACAG
jgi:Darcynin, domain of unknown function